MCPQPWYLKHLMSRFFILGASLVGLQLLFISVLVDSSLNLDRVDEPEALSSLLGAAFLEVKGVYEG